MKAMGLRVTGQRTEEQNSEKGEDRPDPQKQCGDMHRHHAVGYSAAVLCHKCRSLSQPFAPDFIVKLATQIAGEHRDGECKCA